MPVKVFFSYAHEDEPLLKKLKTHLRPLQREGIIELWYDRDINAGAEWEQEVSKHLNEAEIILLLISPDFMDSDYCYSIEMKRALERHERGEAKVIPLILRPTQWQEAPFRKLQALPKNGVALTSRKWHNRDEAFFNVVEALKIEINNVNPNSTIWPSEIRDGQMHELVTDFKNVPVKLIDALSHKRLCPSCIEEFYPGDCRIISRKTGEELRQAPQGWLEKNYARIHPEPLIQPKYLQKEARRECPNCGYLLPVNFENIENLSVVIVGAAGAGRSSYFGSLIYQIKQGLYLKNTHLFIRDISAEEFRLSLDLFYKPPLHIHNSIHHYQPLVFELKNLHFRDGPTKTINLFLYDGAGEDFIDPERIMNFARYALYANAFIFLVDPLSMPKVVEELPTRLKDWPKGQSLSDVLSATKHIIEIYHGLNAEDHLQHIPIAITVSKSDLLKHLVSEKSQPYNFLYPINYQSNHVLPDVKIVDKEVRDFIEEFGDGSILEIAQLFPIVSFFAVSSLGFDPSSTTPSGKIYPIRCLDPLLWILNKLDFIEI